MTVVVYDKDGIPLQTRSGAAVFRRREAFTNWYLHGYGRGIPKESIVKIHKPNGEQVWQGTLAEYFLNRLVFA